jgi:hypothetical protein
VSGDLEKVAAWWPTNGAAGGQTSLKLPEGVAPGEYEMRLISTDPNFYDLLTVVARSEPIHVVDSIVTSTTVDSASTTTSTTIPSVGQCEVEGPTACQTGNPCTVDHCVPAVGCVSTAVEGFSAVTCACERALPDACAGQPVPASIAAGTIGAAAHLRCVECEAAKRLKKAEGPQALAGSRASQRGKLACCLDARGRLGDAKAGRAILATLGDRRA